MGIADILFKRKKELAENNANEGRAFMTDNAEKEGVITLESGLQYEVLLMGEGAKPTAAQTVTCHYHGTTIKGVVFDSSVLRGKTASFPLNRVIKGWTEGLQFMPVGSKFRFTIPPHLAYNNKCLKRLVLILP